ncbi:MAG TPA: signal peptidase I [Streptosporangiaceae bacterium]|nr:signal peptidase I [Streptosporangiaceae bacterium]
MDNADGVTAADSTASDDSAATEGSAAPDTPTPDTPASATSQPQSDGQQPDAPRSEAPAQGTATASSEPPKKNGPPKKKKRLGRELSIIVVAALALTLLLKIFVVQVYEIPSASMENTLLVGDRVLVNKLVYHFRDIHRGDIIVFSGAGSWGDLNGNPIPPPSSNPIVRGWDDVLGGLGLHSNTTYYIKRVIGLPGDHVACCTDGDVTVNGVKLDETSYLFPGAAPSTLQFSVTVPPGRLWVMGDNRAFSDDSRYHQTTSPGYGTIPVNEVAGRAFLIIWPLSQFRDLPIPATFQQAAFNAGPAGLAGGGVVALGVPLVFWRHRRRLTR